MTVTTRSRVALADCEHALADFEASANTPYQRPRWVAVITLLRIVGHVLDKVDKPAASNEAQQRIDDAWKQLNATKPEPRIFHDFIDGDRNLLLKQYQVRSQVNVTIQLGGVGTEGGVHRADHRSTTSSCGTVRSRDATHVSCAARLSRSARGTSTRLMRGRSNDVGSLGESRRGTGLIPQRRMHPNTKPFY